MFIFLLCLVDMVPNRKNNIRINFERGPNMAQIIPGSLSFIVVKVNFFRVHISVAWLLNPFMNREKFTLSTIKDIFQNIRLNSWID